MRVIFFTGRYAFALHAWTYNFFECFLCRRTILQARCPNTDDSLGQSPFVSLVFLQTELGTLQDC